MTKKKFGRIVNFATVATPLNLEGEAAYAASKAAVDSFTRVLAREVATLNITANCVGPTPIETDLIRSVHPRLVAHRLDSLVVHSARFHLPLVGLVRRLVAMILPFVGVFDCYHSQTVIVQPHFASPH